MKRGQNAVLRTGTLRFGVDCATPRDLSALVTDVDLTAMSSDDFVFYNQPRTRGVWMSGDGVEIDLDAVHPAAHAVLCIVSVDPLAPAGTTFGRVTATLRDPAGEAVAVMDVDCSDAETAVICWELYRRTGQWRVRAVGQGYSDGLAGLVTRHGVGVEEPAEALAGGGAPTAAEAGPGIPIEPLDPNHVLERFTMIMEDAARSAGALVSAREFAEGRLDSELSAAVADPTIRNSPHAADTRARAQSRHDDVVSSAHARYAGDSAHLSAELDAIDPALPRSFASWGSAAWTTARPEPQCSTGIRIGELSAPRCGPLRVPLCLPFPLQQPLRIIGPDNADTAAVTSAVVLRMLSADENLHLDIVDISGTLRTLTTHLVHRRDCTIITDAGLLGTYIESSIAAAELAQLDAGGPGGAEAVRRLIVLNHFPYGYDGSRTPLLDALTTYGPALGITTVIVGDGPTAFEEINPGLAQRSHAVPVEGGDWCDPWTSNPWTFTPDRVPAEADRFAHVVGLVARR